MAAALHHCQAPDSHLHLQSCKSPTGQITVFSPPWPVTARWRARLGKPAEPGNPLSPHDRAGTTHWPQALCPRGGGIYTHDRRPRPARAGQENGGRRPRHRPLVGGTIRRATRAHLCRDLDHALHLPPSGHLLDKWRPLDTGICQLQRRHGHRKARGRYRHPQSPPRPRLARRSADGSCGTRSLCCVQGCSGVDRPQ